MSETRTLADVEGMVCDDCNEPVRVSTEEYTGLVMQCQCERRSIKVKRAIPFEWS